MLRLHSSNTAQLPETVWKPNFDRTAQSAGIVHFGIGAFHRAHQAVYTDDAMNAGDRDWGIIGVSLRSASVAEQMNPQDGLYTVTERSGDGSKVRMIGAVQRVLVASKDTAAIVAAIAAPTTHIISFTITEKAWSRPCRLCRRAHRAFRQHRSAPPPHPDRDGRITENSPTLARNAGDSSTPRHRLPRNPRSAWCLDSFRPG